MSKELVREIHAVQNQKRNDALARKTESVRYRVTSLTLLLEAAAMAVVSGFAIYSGWHQHLPNWGKDVLLIAGGFIALRAFIEFVKFLDRRA